MHQRAHLLHSIARLVAERGDFCGDSCVADIGDARGQFIGTHKIGLGQKDVRLHMSFRHYHEKALQPRHVEILLAGLHDEGHVDVGGDLLVFNAASRRLAPAAMNGVA